MTRPVRHIPRQQLILKIEFDNAAGFRSNYLSDIPGGGLRIHSSMEVGQQLHLHISFLGLVDLVQIKTVVRWSLPASHPEGPAAGLSFVDPSPEARAWLSEVLGGSSQIFLPPEPPHRVLLLEAQPFLREIYGQEVHNWAELHNEAPIELVAPGDMAAWFEEITRTPAMLGIIDVDELPATALELYKRVRSDPRSAELPLVVLGKPAGLEPLSSVSDKLLRCLPKPLKFGHLMNTVDSLVRDPSPSRSGNSRG